MTGESEKEAEAARPPEPERRKAQFHGGTYDEWCTVVFWGFILMIALLGLGIIK